MSLGEGAKALHVLFGKRTAALLVLLVLVLVLPTWVLVINMIGWKQANDEALNASRQTDLKFIEIATGILQNNPPADELRPLRNWSARILKYFSGRIDKDDVDIRLTDEQVGILTGKPVSFSKPLDASFSKTSPIGWVRVPHPVQVLDGGSDTQGLPLQGAMVQLNNVKLRTDADPDDVEGHGVIADVDKLCAYVRRVERIEDGGLFLLLTPESLSRCARYANMR